MPKFNFDKIDKEITEAFNRQCVAEHTEQRETLLGLRNIAWAANRSNHQNSTAHYLHTLITLLLQSPENVSLVKMAIESSVHAVEYK